MNTFKKCSLFGLVLSSLFVIALITIYKQPDTEIGLKDFDLTPFKEKIKKKTHPLYGKIHQIVKRIEKVVYKPLNYQTPSLVIFEYEQKIAQVNRNNTMVFSTGFLDDFQQEANLAFVIGHELSHLLRLDIELGQIDKPTCDQLRQNEYIAD